MHIIYISSLFNDKWEMRKGIDSLPGHFDLIFNLSMDVNVIINGHSYPHRLHVVLAFAPIPVFLFYHHTANGTYLPIAHANQIIFSSSSCIDGFMVSCSVERKLAFLIYLSMIDLLSVEIQIYPVCID